VRRAAVVNADPAVAPDIATLILMGSMRKFWLATILIM
jgi:hypothetical protein